jgi:hypothetical protein
MQSVFDRRRLTFWSVRTTKLQSRKKGKEADLYPALIRFVQTKRREEQPFVSIFVSIEMAST